MKETVQEKKAAPESVVVVMEDGRKVEFAGKRTMLKTLVVDTEAGTAAVRIDMVNGQTLLAQVPPQHMVYAAAHGYSQKLGDEVSGMKTEDKLPASDEDKMLALEALHDRLTSSNDWNKVGESGGGVSGASVVLKAIMEVRGKTLAEVKAFLEKTLADAEARGQKLTRAALYASFRNPTSKTGVIIARMEQEKAVKVPAVDADKLLADME